jgi:arylsulfatase A-like enzyme
MNTKPNIVWMITDQHTAGAMSCTGNEWLETPGMDSIAQRGIRFDRAYCTYPLCTPSRASLLTGHYPHQVDCNSNSAGKGGRFFWYRDFPREWLLTHQLTDAGYRCVWSGKDMPPEDGSCGVDLLSPWGDVQVGDKLTEFIKGPHDKPFLAVGAFVNPHNICEWARQCPCPEGEVGDPPPAAELPPLPSNHEPAQHEPEVIRILQRNARFAFEPRGVSPEEWRRYIWAYYRMVEMVDVQVKRILNALDEAGLTDNTLVIFTGDHGDGCAAHRWNQKMILYEEVINIPLLMAGPGIEPGRVDASHLVSNGLDSYPTICEMVGLPVPAHVEGRSLLPLCSDGAEKADWRDELVVETALTAETGPANPLRNAARALLRGNWKYSVYTWARYREQLADLKTDPGEMTNLAVDPANRDEILEMRRHLQEWKERTGDFFQVPGYEMISPDGGWAELEQIRRSAYA